MESPPLDKEEWDDDDELLWLADDHYEEWVLDNEEYHEES